MTSQQKKQMHKGIYGIATSKNYQTKEVSGIHNLMHDVNTGEGGSEGDENNFGPFVRGHVRMPMSLLVPLIGGSGILEGPSASWTAWLGHLNADVPIEENFPILLCWKLSSFLHFLLYINIPDIQNIL